MVKLSHTLRISFVSIRLQSVHHHVVDETSPSSAGFRLESDVLESVVERRKEFDAHVWNHSDDAFQAAFDERRHLHREEKAFLDVLVKALATSSDEFARKLTSGIQKNPEFILPLLQLCGLTRSKIVTDLTAMGHPRISGPETLVAREKMWPDATKYLEISLKRVMLPIVHLEDELRHAIYDSLNQATWPGYVRQERAKKQGHEAEGRMARLLDALNLSFAPLEKATNPLCRDIQIHGVSFDLISPNPDSPRLFIKSTVHTSNIGQYGESKDALEIEEASQMLKTKFKNKKPVLLAMVDGVGMQTNTAGLHGVLGTADEFCQFKTIWKVAVLAAEAQDRQVQIYLPDKDVHTGFLSRHSSGAQLLTKMPNSPLVEAGEAYIKLEE